jgi:hypothetical protein
MRTLPDPGEGEVFGESRECFEGVVAFLEGDEASGLDHGELECRLEVEGRELLRSSTRTTWTYGLRTRSASMPWSMATECPGGRWRPATSGPWPRSSARSASVAWPTAGGDTPTCAPPMRC